MRSNAVKKEIYSADVEKDAVETPVQPKQVLKLVEKQQAAYNEQEGQSMDVDYEAFMSKYGIKAFA